jgi:hypothetical protein
MACLLRSAQETAKRHRFGRPPAFIVSDTTG